MKRLSQITITCFLILFSSEAFSQEIIKGKFEHVVLFWLKNSESEADKAKLEKGMRALLKSSKYVVSAHLGIPAMTDRAIVDNSYTFNYTVTFNSKEDQDAYQEEDVHLTFLEEYKDLWNKVLIYDSVNLLEED